jgi:hypothetical protein
VTRSYIPMHSIVRIDEVEKEGAVKVSDAKNSGKVTMFPAPGFRPSPGSDAPGDG